MRRPAGRCDLLVVGGGPAGATLATLVKKYNPSARVVLLEQARFPRHHVGESLLPGLVPVLKEMGAYDAVVAQDFIKKIGITFVWGDDRRPWDSDFSEAKLALWKRGMATDIEFTWQVERARYDAVLLERARAAGVEVLEGRAAATLVEGGRIAGAVVERAGRRETVRARLLADCSGQNGFLAAARQARDYLPQLKNVAAYAYYRGARWKYRYQGHPDKTRLFVCSVPEGWFWYIPLSQKTVSVGLIAKHGVFKASGFKDMEPFFAGAVERCAELRSLLRGARRLKGVDPAQPEKDLFTAADWSYSSREVCGDGWLACGDAAFFIDPLLSSGVLMAHLSAQRAAYAVTTAWRSSPEVGAAVWKDYAAFCAKTAGRVLSLVEFWYQHDPNARRWRSLAGGSLRSGGPLDLGDEAAFAAMIGGLTHSIERLYCGPGGGLRRRPDAGRSEWAGQGNRDKLVPYLFLEGPNRKAWRKPRPSPRRVEQPQDAVPSWSAQPRWTTAWVPVDGTGLLRPVTELSLDAAGGRVTRLLPRLHARLLRLVDGRRRLSEIEDLALERSSAPRYEVSHQWRALSEDLAALGALSLRPAPAAPRPGPVSRMRRAEDAFMTGRPAEAARLLAGWRGGGWPLALRGEALRRLGRAEEAEKDLDAALGSAEPRGRSLAELRGDLEERAERDWYASSALAWRARARLDLGRAEEALADAEAALYSNEESFDALSARAAALRALGRGREAARDAAAAARLESRGRPGAIDKAGISGYKMA